MEVRLYSYVFYLYKSLSRDHTNHIYVVVALAFFQHNESCSDGEYIDPEVDGKEG